MRFPATLIPRLLPGGLAALLAALPARAALPDNFSRLENWQVYTSGPGSLDVVTDSKGRVQLATESVTEAGQTRAVRIITKSAWPELNFVRAGETVGLVLDSLSITSAGATSTFLFGLTPDPANANIHTRTNALYFAQNGTANASLVLRDGGAAVTLWTTTDPRKLAYDYHQIRLVLTRTTWTLVTCDATGHELVNEAGVFAVPAHREWQTSPLHAHLTLNQSSNNGARATLRLKGFLPFITTPAFPSP